jgi:ribonuclease P protein component
LGLAAHERLRRRPDFERAYREGTKVHTRFMTVFLVPNSCSHPRLGVAASRKLGGAVDRNRAKRLTRELFRRHKIETEPGIDVVVVPRREMLDAAFVSLEADYAKALARGQGPRSPRPPRHAGGRSRPS